MCIFGYTHVHVSKELTFTKLLETSPAFILRALEEAATGGTYMLTIVYKNRYL